MIALYSKHKSWNPDQPLEMNFLAVMNPDMQSSCAANPERCYFGDSPSIAEVKMATNTKFTQQWIVVQLDAVLATLGSKDTVDSKILEAIAQDIISNYSWLNTAEFLLFCSRCRVGKYGQLAYGQVTVNDIVSKIPNFLSEREKEMTRYKRLQDNAEREREAENRKRNSVTHSEAYRIINAAADGDIEAQHRLHDDPRNWAERIYSIEWGNIDEAFKAKIAEYFNIAVNFLTKLPTAHFPNSRYAKFLEGADKGYYRIIE